MQFVDIRLSLESSSSQPQIIELLKTNGIDCIQTSSGLCAKSPGSIDKIKDLLKSKDLLSGVTLTELDKSAELPKDVQAFLNADSPGQ